MQACGTLCLYSQSQRAGSPWADLDALFNKVAEWHEQESAGWNEDAGDLDLERYFPHTSPTLVVFERFDNLLGRRLEIKGDIRVWTVGRGSSLSSPNRGVAKRDRRASNRGEPWGVAVDFGELLQPMVAWSQILSRLGAQERRFISERVSTKREGLLLAQYARPTPDGQRRGVVAIKVVPAAGPAPRLVALQSEDRGVAIRNRRGADQVRLAGLHVGVVGVGAVGSFLADLLARSGVGRLTLVDSDSMRVGNSVRHLLGPSCANQPKVYAVARSLASRELMPADAVTAVDKPVTPEVLWDLFSRCDIVVDATAAPDVRAMFEHLGKVAGEQWVEVALYRSGAIARADRLGPGTAPAVDRPPQIAHVEGDDGVRETGCGDPVSSTPPTAVAAAAALAARLVIDTARTRRQRQLPDSTVEVLAPTPADAVPAGDPYLDVGVVTS